MTARLTLPRESRGLVGARREDVAPPDLALVTVDLVPTGRRTVCPAQVHRYPSLGIVIFELVGGFISGVAAEGKTKDRGHRIVLLACAGVVKPLIGVRAGTGLQCGMSVWVVQ